MQVAADAYLALGETDRAEEILARGMAEAGAQDNQLARLRWLQLQGSILAKRGDTEGSLRSFVEAVTSARTMPHPYEKARAMYAWGTALSESGDPGAGREQLEQALAIFRRLGAGPEADRTERAMGEPAPA
jgi:tetratricopeptide (TPR) repeat protein